MVSPVSEDAPEDLRKTAGALEAQALVEQELLPTDQAPALNKVGWHCHCLFRRSSLWHQDLDAYRTRKPWGISVLII